MVEPLKPSRGGFQKPFGCARFVLDFLQGLGPNYGVAGIDPEEGATQNDILASYKLALHLAWVEDQLAGENESRLHKGLAIFSPQEEAERRAYWMRCYPLGRCRMRYHSFLIYFGLLKRLSWVEPTGQAEPSVAQEMMALEPGEKSRAAGQPRVYYRLTAEGRAASDSAITNPLVALYPQFSPDYFARKRAERRYIRCR